MRYKASSKEADSVPSKIKNNLFSYRDEPKAWEQLSDDQLMRNWYMIGHTKRHELSFELPDVESLLREAEEGDSQAQYTLGKMYFNGIGVGSDCFRAAFWFSKASAAGNPFAQYELAKMCKFGIVIEEDSEQARMLFEESYEAFLSLEEHRPDKAVETKLATICEKELVDITDSDRVIDWRSRAEGREKTIQPAAKAPVSQAQGLLEQPLTYKPEYVCTSDAKAGEAFETLKSVQTDHAAINTIHAKPKSDANEAAEKTPESAPAQDDEPKAQPQSSSGGREPDFEDEAEEYENSQETSESALAQDDEPVAQPQPSSGGSEPDFEDETPKEEAPQEFPESAPVQDDEPSVQPQASNGNGEPNIGDEVLKDEEPQELPESTPLQDAGPSAQPQSSNVGGEPDFENEVPKDEEPQELPESDPLCNNGLAVQLQSSGECRDGESVSCKECATTEEVPLTVPPERTTTLHEVISSLEELLHVFPGSSNAVLDGDRVVSGIIDRIEIYSDTVLISVEVGELRRPYPVSEIGKTLFVGDNFMSEAERAAGGMANND